MILNIDSNAAYLVASKARSRASGFYYMGNKNKQLINGPVASNTKIIKNVMSSASDAEIGALYMNDKLTVPMQTTLAELGHPLPPTPIQKLMTALPTALSTPLSDKINPKPSTCVSTGSAIKLNKNNSTSIVPPGLST